MTFKLVFPELWKFVLFLNVFFFNEFGFQHNVGLLH